jgi:hypothetical protein
VSAAISRTPRGAFLVEDAAISRGAGFQRRRVEPAELELLVESGELRFLQTASKVDR